jgi:hypothetical protein
MEKCPSAFYDGLKSALNLENKKVDFSIFLSCTCFANFLRWKDSEYQDMRLSL